MNRIIRKFFCFFSVGMKNQHFTVTNYTPNSMITLKSSNGISRPALTLNVSAAGPNQAKVTFLLYFDNKSMLFQVSFTYLISYLN